MHSIAWSMCILNLTVSQWYIGQGLTVRMQYDVKLPVISGRRAKQNGLQSVGQPLSPRE